MLDGLPREGDTVVGKYVIERVLAVGGMGAVMGARDLALERRVAIKFLLPKVLASNDVRERFFREARAAVSIRSEHVVDVYEIGVAPPDVPFIVMEYLPGRDLHKMLEGRAPLPTHEAIDYVLQACEALAEAHALGIVHRDMKPSNLFVTHRPDGSAFIKVLDFGISKTSGMLDPGAKSLTQSSVALGSPLYMSPEQVRNSKVVDARTDIWSIGVVLFELLTKELPFDGETIPSLAAAIASDAPRLLRSIRPDVPVELEAVVSRCLEKDPAKRYQKIGDLARALLPFSASGTRAVVFDRIESRNAVSPLAFESTTERRSPLSEEVTQEAPPGDARAGAATTAGLGTTQRQAERKRRSLGWAAVSFIAVAAGGVGLLQLRAASAPIVTPASTGNTVMPDETASALPAAQSTTVSLPVAPPAVSVPPAVASARPEAKTDAVVSTPKPRPGAPGTPRRSPPSPGVVKSATVAASAAPPPPKPLVPSALEGNR